MSEHIKTALAVAAFLLVYGVVGHFDYEDELNREASLNDFRTTTKESSNERTRTRPARTSGNNSR